MSMYKVPSMRGYWSSDPIMQVLYSKYYANILNSQYYAIEKIEKLRANVYFNDNQKMTSRNDENHDCAKLGWCWTILTIVFQKVYLQLNNNQ